MNNMMLQPPDSSERPAPGDQRPCPPISTGPHHLQESLVEINLVKAISVKLCCSAGFALTVCWNHAWSQSGLMALVALLTIIRRAPKWSYSEDSFLLTWIALLCASLVAQLLKNLPAMWETWLQSLGWEDPLEKGKATHSNIQT